MHFREVVTIGAIGAICLLFLILVAYAAYGIVICFAEDSTLNNFKNFSIINMVLGVLGTIIFLASMLGLIIVIRKGGFSKCHDSDSSSSSNSVTSGISSSAGPSLGSFAVSDSGSNSETVRVSSRAPRLKSRLSAFMFSRPDPKSGTDPDAFSGSDVSSTKTAVTKILSPPVLSSRRNSLPARFSSLIESPVTTRRTRRNSLPASSSGSINDTSDGSDIDSRRDGSDKDGRRDGLDSDSGSDSDAGSRPGPARSRSRSGSRTVSSLSSRLPSRRFSLSLDEDDSLEELSKLSSEELEKLLKGLD